MNSFSCLAILPNPGSCSTHRDHSLGCSSMPEALRAHPHPAHILLLLKCDFWGVKQELISTFDKSLEMPTHHPLTQDPLSSKKLQIRNHQSWEISKNDCPHVSTKYLCVRGLDWAWAKVVHMVVMVPILTVHAYLGIITTRIQWGLFLNR